MFFDRTEYVIFNRPTEQDISDKYLNIGLVFVFAFNALVILAYPLGNNDLGIFFFFLKEDSNFYKLYLEPYFFSLQISNIEAIGAVLYDYYFLAIIGAALVLLLGMVGAILLTQSVNVSSNVLVYKHQDIRKQLLRRNI